MEPLDFGILETMLCEVTEDIRIAALAVSLGLFA
jgi:hypothetical protein